MILKQYYLGCLAHASYLIADEDAKVAAVVDPQRDVDQYVADAEQLGVQIQHVLLTHFHADFVAGHLELRDRLGARIHLGAQAEAEYAFEPMADGGVLELGEVKLRFLETPGHTPESASIVVNDGTGPPHAVLTGDTLFIGDVGRPDLMASLGITAEELAGMLYDSLHGKLLKLPDATLLYPAHGAGSMCGKNLSTDTVSTIGDQRRFNYALQPMSKEEFIELVTSGQPQAPDYFSFDAMLNRQERQTLERSMESMLVPLSLEQVIDKQSGGAQVLDAREADAFAAGYLKDSLHVGLGGKYATWAGTILDRHRPIVLVTDPDREREAAMRLGRIGFDHVEGYLQGGPAAFAQQTDLVDRFERLSAQELATEVLGQTQIAVLDVRGIGERERGHVRGDVHIPLPELAKRADELPRDRRMLVYCASGYRSAIAVSLLKELGFDAVADVRGMVVGAEESTSVLDGVPD